MLGLRLGRGVKRSGPPPRRKALDRGKGPTTDPAKVRAWQDRTRRPLPHQSEKGKARAQAATTAGRRAKDRDGHRCAALDLIPGHTCWGPLDPQHVIPRSVRRDLAADPANIVPLCRLAHDYVGDHPEEAHALGLHGWTWEEPAALAETRRARHLDGLGARVPLHRAEVVRPSTPQEHP